MAFPNIPIQQQFNRYQDKGLVGQLAQNDNGVWFRDVATAGVELTPGQGVYLDTSGGATSGQWLLPTAGNEDLVTHVLSFDSTMLNTDSAISGNQLSSITYAVGAIAPAYQVGSVFVEAGAVILRGQVVQYDVAGDNYIVNGLVTPKLLMIALSDAQSGEVFPIRINRLA